MMSSMLYTRKGDDGTTKLFSAAPRLGAVGQETASDGETGKGRRISKMSCSTEALGALDELNSFLGYVKAMAQKEDSVLPESGLKLSDALERAQENLFIIQAEAAGAPDKKVSEGKVKEVEAIIDAIEREIPPITGFSIAGGTELSAFLDVVRAVSRRAERQLVLLFESGERDISEHTRAYMNRLSSLLFALARYANHKAGVKEKNPSYK